jgi:competence protein ComEA
MSHVLYKSCFYLFLHILTIISTLCYYLSWKCTRRRDPEILTTPPYHVGPPAAHQISQQQTTPLVGTSNQLAPGGSTPLPSTSSQKRTYIRIIAVIIVIGLAIALYLISRSPTTTPPAPSITQQHVSTSSCTTHTTRTPTNASADAGSTIQVYIVGAVKHPGLYTLPADARVYH